MIEQDPSPDIDLAREARTASVRDPEADRQRPRQHSGLRSSTGRLLAGLLCCLVLAGCGGDPCAGIELDVDYCVNDPNRPVQSAGCGLAEFSLKNVSADPRLITLAVIRPDAIPEAFEMPSVRVDGKSVHRDTITPTAPGHRLVIQACE
jgi:hypothetical protein